MRDESHLDDMRAAIRGDFERLAERLGSQDLMRVSDEAQDEPAATPDEEESGVPEPAEPGTEEERPAAEADEPPTSVEKHADATGEPPSEEPAPSRRGLLARLLGL